MNLTHEVRLFGPGRLPDSAFEFFRNVNGALQPVEERRSDLYLIIPNCRTVGVKARGGGAGSGKSKLEVKALRQPEDTSAVMLLGRAVEVERWAKWSYGEPPVDPLISALVSNLLGEWLTVEKTRWTRKFTHSANGGLVELDARERPSAATNMELVDVVAAGQHFWGVGLETFGPESIARNLLRLMLAKFSTDDAGLFASLDSLSYAGLVSTFADPGGV